MSTPKEIFRNSIKSEFGKLQAKGGVSDFGSYKASEEDKFNKMATENKKENMIGNAPKLKKPIGKMMGVGKKESKEAASTASTGGYSTKLFTDGNEFMNKSESETPKKVEATEAATSANVGGYSQPSIWAPSKNKWGPSKKTQIPGGSFVKVKKKCKTFPYCNQGDVNALILKKNKSLREAVYKVSKKTGLNENVIVTILMEEFKKLKQRNKL